VAEQLSYGHFFVLFSVTLLVPALAWTPAQHSACSSELLGSTGTTGTRHHARILFSVFHTHILYSDKAVD
uniref:Uncharacterized protein n=1 Tax=Otus sunia TaxID=257818 RepID=A0A8C8BHI3_9STRI